MKLCKSCEKTFDKINIWTFTWTSVIVSRDKILKQTFYLKTKELNAGLIYLSIYNILSKIKNSKLSLPSSYCLPCQVVNRQVANTNLFWSSGVSFCHVISPSKPAMAFLVTSLAWIHFLSTQRNWNKYPCNHCDYQATHQSSLQSHM